jgi:glycosyltransferase involved in cell wall biosynthesis
MMYKIARQSRDANLVLIDTYSTWAFYFAYAGGMLCRLFKLRYVPILHGGNLPHRLEHSPLLCRRLFGNSYTNVVVSEYLRWHLQVKSFRNELIPNGIDIECYPFFLREVLKPRLLWVRAFEKTYAPDMALHTLSKLLQKYPEATLTMVGPEKDGSLEACKLLANKMGISDKVVFTGKLERADWISLAKEHDIFINTAKFDNTPVSVVEAMALGLPVVSTDAGGIPFLIENGVDGILSGVGDASAMALAIETLLQSGELVGKICLAARKKAEQYAWDNTRPKWNLLLRDI